MSPAPPTAFFAALANDTRLRCLVLLAQQRELCVCELTYALRLSQPHISRHLASLRENGIVADRRTGLWVHYRIAEDLPEWCHGVVAQTAASLTAIAPFDADRQRLASMPNRPDLPRCA
ncbi:MAG: ArsR family transcriptional regulator [Sphingobacteriia bacterium]|nr:ArsR family transcriptional regulator [Sphingobacteriia bacterium]NCC41733.1 ArsR family transcriptional regulator [Gammaproteobacteria bacterium]